VERWKDKNGNQIKGHDIEVRAEDDGCTEADITAQAAERLLRSQGLVGVIGPACSAGAQAAIPVYAQAGIVAISASATQSALATSQPEGRFFFRTAYRNDLEGILVGLFASVALQAEKAYLIDDGELYGTDLADAAQRALRDNDVTVTRESVRRGMVDFSQLAAKIVVENPDLVGFAGFNPEAALLYRQLRDAGYTGIFGSVDAAASVPSFVEPVGAAAEGVVFAGCSLTLPPDFVAQFEDVHGGRPEASAFVAQDADAVTILLNAVAQVAVEQADGSLTIDPAALRDAVGATSLEGGLSGSFAFDENGDRIPRQGDVLSQVVDEALSSGDIDIFADLGLVPCQVQDGKLVNLLGPGAGQIR
jgi:branched-chain amino acid transport system substrate-binding protein